MKKGPLSDKEKESILINRDSMSTAEIASFIDRSEYIVKKTIKQEEERVEAEQAKIKAEPSLFERTMGKAENATVMTGEASMIGDVLRKGKKPNRFANSCIHKVK